MLPQVSCDDALTESGVSNVALYNEFVAAIWVAESPFVKAPVASWSGFIPNVGKYLTELVELVDEVAVPRIRSEAWPPKGDSAQRTKR